MQFTALDDFWSDEMQSQYCAGLSYAATSNTLKLLVEEWIAQGKAELSAAPITKISGKE